MSDKSLDLAKARADIARAKEALDMKKGAQPWALSSTYVPPDVGPSHSRVGDGSKFSEFTSDLAMSLPQETGMRTPNALLYNVFPDTNRGAYPGAGTLDFLLGQNIRNADAAYNRGVKPQGDNSVLSWEGYKSGFIPALEAVGLGFDVSDIARPLIKKGLGGTVGGRKYDEFHENSRTWERGTPTKYAPEDAVNPYTGQPRNQIDMLTERKEQLLGEKAARQGLTTPVDTSRREALHKMAGAAPYAAAAAATPLALSAAGKVVRHVKGGDELIETAEQLTKAFENSLFKGDDITSKITMSNAEYNNLYADFIEKNKHRISPELGGSLPKPYTRASAEQELESILKSRGTRGKIDPLSDNFADHYTPDEIEKLRESVWEEKHVIDERANALDDELIDMMSSRDLPQETRQLIRNIRYGDNGQFGGPRVSLDRQQRYDMINDAPLELQGRLREYLDATFKSDDLASTRYALDDVNKELRRIHDMDEFGKTRMDKVNPKLDEYIDARSRVAPHSKIGDVEDQLHLLDEYRGQYWDNGVEPNDFVYDIKSKFPNNKLDSLDNYYFNTEHGFDPGRWLYDDMTGASRYENGAEMYMDMSDPMPFMYKSVEDPVKGGKLEALFKKNTSQFGVDSDIFKELRAIDQAAFEVNEAVQRADAIYKGTGMRVSPIDILRENTGDSFEDTLRYLSEYSDDIFSRLHTNYKTYDPGNNVLDLAAKHTSPENKEVLQNALALLKEGKTRTDVQSYILKNAKIADDKWNDETNLIDIFKRLVDRERFKAKAKRVEHLHLSQIEDAVDTYRQTKHTPKGRTRDVGKSLVDEAIDNPVATGAGAGVAAAGVYAASRMGKSMTRRKFFEESGNTAAVGLGAGLAGGVGAKIAKSSRVADDIPAGAATKPAKAVPEGPRQYKSADELQDEFDMYLSETMDSNSLEYMDALNYRYDELFDDFVREKYKEGLVPESMYSAFQSGDLFLGGMVGAAGLGAKLKSGAAKVGDFAKKSYQETKQAIKEDPPHGLFISDPDRNVWIKHPFFKTPKGKAIIGGLIGGFALDAFTGPSRDVLDKKSHESPYKDIDAALLEAKDRFGDNKRKVEEFLYSALEKKHITLREYLNAVGLNVDWAGKPSKD